MGSITLHKSATKQTNRHIMLTNT